MQAADTILSFNFTLLPMNHLCLLTALCLAAHAPAQPPSAGETEIFSDLFERAELGSAWRVVTPAFTIADGVLKGSQTRSDHGAVGSIHAPFRDGVIEFRFRFEGATSINAVCDDKGFKGSHAGHICRVAITPKQIRLGDDKEGVMRNDILEMRKDPARKAEAEKLLAGRGSTVPVKLEPGQWHTMRIAITGDTLRAALDGAPVASLQSPGIAHATKTDFHFTVTGKDALLDDIRILSIGKAAAKD